MSPWWRKLDCRLRINRVAYAEHWGRFRMRHTASASSRNPACLRDSAVSRRPGPRAFTASAKTSSAPQSFTNVTNSSIWSGLSAIPGSNGHSNPVDAQAKLVSPSHGCHSLGDGRRKRLDHGQATLACSGPRQAESDKDAVPMFLEQVEVSHDGGILGQNPNRPARLVKDGLQTPPPHVVLLCPRTPGIDGCAQLNHPAISPAGGVVANLFRNVRVNDAVAVLEGAFAGVLETDMAPQQGAAGTVGATVPALDSDVH